MNEFKQLLVLVDDEEEHKQEEGGVQTDAGMEEDAVVGEQAGGRGGDTQQKKRWALRNGTGLYCIKNDATAAADSQQQQSVETECVHVEGGTPAPGVE